MHTKDTALTLRTCFDGEGVLKMFLDNLSARVLRIIDENDYSYETAAELCDMSTRHFGNIVRLITPRERK